MFYIYCYTNKFNNKKYVGQTIWPAQRRGEHRYAANNPNAKDYNSLFHQKLREYGEENFTFEILEEIDTTNTDFVDEREQYWIQTLSSYVKTGQGYNVTLGGQNKGRHKIIELNTVKQVIQLLKTNMTYKEIHDQMGISLQTIVNINRGSYINSPQENYPIRPFRISEDVKLAIKEVLLSGTSKTRQQIADDFGVSLSIVKRIKAELKNQEPVSTIKG